MPILRSHTYLQDLQAKAKISAFRRVFIPNSNVETETDKRKEQLRHTRISTIWKTNWHLGNTN